MISPSLSLFQKGLYDLGAELYDRIAGDVVVFSSAVRVAVDDREGPLPQTQIDTQHNAFWPWRKFICPTFQLFRTRHISVVMKVDKNYKEHFIFHVCKGPFPKIMKFCKQYIHHKIIMFTKLLLCIGSVSHRVISWFYLCLVLLLFATTSEGLSWCTNSCCLKLNRASLSGRVKWRVLSCITWHNMYQVSCCVP